MGGTVDAGAGGAVEGSAAAGGDGGWEASGPEGAAVAAGTEAAEVAGVAGASAVAEGAGGVTIEGPDWTAGTAIAVPVPSVVSVQRAAVKRRFLVEAGRNGMRNLPVGYAGGQPHMRLSAT